MVVIPFIVSIICFYMIGMGIGKARWEIEKFLKRRSGLAKLTPKRARKLERLG
jgi:hypothetical protein